MTKFAVILRATLFTTLLTGFIGCKGADDESFVAVVQVNDVGGRFHIALRSDGSVIAIDPSENQQNAAELNLTPPSDLQNVIDV